MRSGKSFWIELQGGADNAMGIALKKAVEMASIKNCGIMIFVDEPKNIKNIAICDKCNQQLFEQLQSDGKTIYEGVEISTCTKKNSPTHFSGVGIIAYGSYDLMRVVQEITGDLDIILVPQLLDEGKLWAAAYHAEKII